VRWCIIGDIGAVLCGCGQLVHPSSFVIARKQALQSGWSSSLSLVERLEENKKTGRMFFVFCSEESGRMGFSG
jgi:hypothetical protein